ncbi:hypothetical protein RI065_03215 [Mycoplasmatota bacterium zrk1]
MTKTQLLKRALPMFLSLVAILLLAFSCSAFKTNKTEPKISSEDSIYAELGSMKLTNNEVYQKLIDSFGANEVISIVDEDLLSTYVEIAKVDPDFDVNEVLEREMYNGLTLSEATKIYTTEEISKLQANFNDSLVINGYNSIDEFKDAAYLSHARKLYVIDALLIEYEESSSDEPSFSLNNLREEYENFYYDQTCAIKIKFSTLEEAEDALVRHGLDVNNAEELVKAYYKDGEYISPDNETEYPTDPIELAKLELTSAEILEAYVAIYNETYENKDAITYSNGTVLECGSEDLTINFDELYRQSSTQANYIFRVLSSETTNTEFISNVPYTKKPVPLTVSVDEEGASKTGYFIIYKVSGDNQNTFIDLFDEMTDEEYTDFLSKKPSDIKAGVNSELLDTLLDKIIDKMVDNNSLVNEYLSKLRTNKELKLYDSYLEKSFSTMFGNTVTNKGDNSIIFSYLNKDNELVNITADQLFENLSDRYGATTATLLLNAKIPLSDELLSDEVITEEKENEIKQTITNHKLQFQQGAYATYGFDPTSMSWDTFMYTGFGVRSEIELYNTYISNEIRVAFEEELFNNTEVSDILYDKMIEYHKEAFSVDIMHFLIYVDNNEDSEPDMYLEDNDNWTDYQHALALELIDSLRDRLYEEIDTEEITVDSLNEIASEYNEASYESDPNAEGYSEWAKYKRAGLIVKVEDIGEVTSKGFEQPFTDEAKIMYNDMITEDLSYQVSENNVTTRYGYHLLYSYNYKEKLDAYPDDDKLYPSKDDIQKYLQSDLEQSTEIKAFIDEYFVPIKEEYLSTSSTLIYDNLRLSMGDITFNDPELQSDYANALESNRNTIERNQ